MSTTIYHGFRLPEHLDVAGLFAWVGGIRPLFQEATLTILQEEWVRRSVTLFDKEILQEHLQEEGDAPVRKTPGGVARKVREIMHEEMWEARQQGRSNHLGTEARLSVFCHGKALYAMFLAQMPALEKIFESLPGVQEFRYWNNTDAPEGISAEAWDARGEAWDRVLGSSGTIAENSATFQLVSPDLAFLVSWEKGMGSLNESWTGTVGQRARRAAMETRAAMAPPEVEEASRSARSVGPILRFSDSLKEGKVPAFNRALALAEEILPARVEWSWLQGDPTPSEDFSGKEPRPALPRP